MKPVRPANWASWEGRAVHMPFACPFCPRGYVTLAGVGSHLILKHAGKKIPTETQLRGEA